MRKHAARPEELSSLVDIRDVRIDNSLSPEERARSFVEQIKDPYCFRVGDVKVRVVYAGKEETLNDCFCNMISSI